MLVASQSSWKPTCFSRFVRALDTSTSTAQIITDVGPAYIKAMGNRQGPHALACEWVGTQLAKWFGLTTFDCTILELDEIDEIPFPRGGQAGPGPAFVTRAEPGHTWGGTAGELSQLDNPQDVARLVAFDTWTLNCDRHPPNLKVRKPNYDNVFLSEERANRGHFWLVAMDHTHCFTCGRDLTERMASIDRTKDKRVYGLFPGFLDAVQKHRPELRDALEYLGTFDKPRCERIVDSIPDEWEVPNGARAAMCELISQRATFVADNLEEWLAPDCWSQGELDFERHGGQS